MRNDIIQPGGTFATLTYFWEQIAWANAYV